MLKIMHKLIDMEHSPLLLDEPFSPANFGSRWKVYSGEWWIDGEWLTGKNPENCPGMVVSTDDFTGNILLDFEAMTVQPSTHDINAMWNGSWDEEINRRGTAYVAGVEGWWDGKVGIEKSPEYKLTAGTPLFDFNPGQTYHIQCGSVDGHCFIFIDGRLILEVTDPDPIDSQKHAKIGFEAYSSFIRIRNLQVKRITWQPLDDSYRPEF
jgi:hypothetical protein